MRDVRSEVSFCKPNENISAMRILNNSLIGASVVLMAAATATAQVSYSETFDLDLAGYTITGGYGPGSGWAGGGFRYPIGGVDGCPVINVYSGAPTATLTSPLVGSAIGGTISLTFDTKKNNYNGSTGETDLPHGTIEAFYGPTASGPWTSIVAVSDQAETGVGYSAGGSFSTSGDVYIQFQYTRTGGDWDGYVDNIVLTETGGGACAGTPTPGDTTVLGEACSYGDMLTLGLQNTTSGSGVSYQWYESADGVTYSAFGTDAASQVVTLSAPTYYYCDVTCTTGPSTGSSNPVFADLSAPTFPEGFDSVIDPGCWTFADIVGTSMDIQYEVSDAFGIGAGSVEFDFYGAFVPGDQAELVSPIFAPVAGGTNVYFDVSGATYTAGEADVVELQESVDGGLNWTVVATMTNSADGTGVLNTAGAKSGTHTPAADEWASLAYPLSAGANRIRFVATSDYGNQVQIDNVSVGVLPSARHTAYGTGCADPFALSSATPPVDDAVVTFDVTGAPEAQAASGVYFGVVIISFSQVFPGFDLAVIGAEPGCNAFVGGLDVLEGYVSVGSDSASVVLDLPPGIPPGTLLYEQAAAVVEATATNPAGLLTSNGLRSYINTF